MKNDIQKMKEFAKALSAIGKLSSEVAKNLQHLALEWEKFSKALQKKGKSNEK